MKVFVDNIKKAFTLAEVLITLGIIGVVAAITIPVLNNLVQDAQCKTAYKKAYSIATQAFSEANRQDLLVSVAGEGDFLNSDNFLAFMGQFKVTKKCINVDNEQCWNPTGDNLNGYPNSWSYAFVDASGMAWSMYWGAAANIFVDTNGDKMPNKWGKDRFVFILFGQDGNINQEGGIPIILMPYDDGWHYSDYYGKSWLLN